MPLIERQLRLLKQISLMQTYQKKKRPSVFITFLPGYVYQCYMHLVLDVRETEAALYIDGEIEAQKKSFPS